MLLDDERLARERAQIVIVDAEALAIRARHFHGLHPLGVEERVRQALDGVRPFLRTHGGNVELLDVRDGVVYLRLEGSCDGCPSSAATMEQTIKEAIFGRAPEVTAVEVEGLAEAPTPADDGLARLALPVL